MHWDRSKKIINFTSIEISRSWTNKQPFYNGALFGLIRVFHRPLCSAPIAFYFIFISISVFFYIPFFFFISSFCFRKTFKTSLPQLPLYQTPSFWYAVYEGKEFFHILNDSVLLLACFYLRFVLFQASVFANYWTQVSFSLCTAL